MQLPSMTTDPEVRFTLPKTVTPDVILICFDDLTSIDEDSQFWLWTMRARSTIVFMFAVDRIRMRPPEASAKSVKRYQVDYKTLRQRYLWPTHELSEELGSVYVCLYGTSLSVESFLWDFHQR